MLGTKKNWLSEMFFYTHIPYFENNHNIGNFNQLLKHYHMTRIRSEITSCIKIDKSLVLNCNILSNFGAWTIGLFFFC